MPVYPDVPAFELPPDWVCEVLSPRTRRVDLTDKRGIYAAHGVAFLWLVDPLARTLDAFALREAAWVLLGAAGETPMSGCRPSTPPPSRLRRSGRWSPRRADTRAARVLTLLRCTTSMCTMEHQSHPYRSVLYMPGSNPRALDKARTLAADALILDLEDAVAPAEKARARELVCGAVRQGGYGRRKLILRINALATEWGTADLAAAAEAGPDAILVPKVDGPADIAAVAAGMAAAPERTTIWAMMETPLGTLNAGAIAAGHPRLGGFVLGTNDLVKDLGAAHTPDRRPVLTALALCLLAARAHGLVCVDGVYNAFQDDEGLAAQCRQGRAMGFDGKTLIHPRQIAVANDVFAPSEAELARARAEVEAFEAAGARGEGVAVLDGRIVENLHVVAARRLIARSQAIAALAETAAEAPS